MITYGHFLGGDPRNFTPDVECSTEEERAAHKAACEAWDRGERPDIGGPHKPLIKDGVVIGHVTICGYGLGVTSMPDRCDECGHLGDDVDGVPPLCAECLDGMSRETFPCTGYSNCRNLVDSDDGVCGECHDRNDRENNGGCPGCGGSCPVACR
jgi:hypothetical protein